MTTAPDKPLLVATAMLPASAAWRVAHPGAKMDATALADLLRPILAEVYPSPASSIPRTPGVTIGSNRKDIDGEWIASIEANPLFAGVDVKRELGKCRFWCENNGKRRCSRRLFVNWLNKAVSEAPLAVDGRGQSSRPALSAAAQPWAQERIGWRELLTGYPLRNPASANYRDHWEDISDSGKQFIWSLK